MITVIANQSLLDLAIQENGNVDAVFDLAVANNISITEILSPGKEIIPVKSDYSNFETANYFKGRSKKIATGLNFEDSEILEPEFGIGLMEIGSTFIVR